MRRPELIMSPEWPDERTQEWYPSPKDVWCIRLHWPVQHLPPAMGYLPTAKQLGEDPSREYYLEVDLDFLPDELAVVAADPSPDGSHAHATLDYSELARITESADNSSPLPPALRIFRDYPPNAEPGPPPTRRYAGHLRVIELPLHTSPDPAPDDTLPF
jgi:hypothetical protein